MRQRCFEPGERIPDEYRDESIALVEARGKPPEDYEIGSPCWVEASIFGKGNQAKTRWRMENRPLIEAWESKQI